MNLPGFAKVYMARISPPCSEITLLVSKGMDTRLTLRERFRLQFHFMICSGCKRFNIQIQLLQKIIHQSFGSTSEIIGNSTAPTDELASAFPEAMPKEARVRIQTAISTAIGEQ